jgi:hypothetical protein
MSLSLELDVLYHSKNLEEYLYLKGIKDVKNTAMRMKTWQTKTSSSRFEVQCPGASVAFTGLSGHK